MRKRRGDWSGVFPATLVPYVDDDIRLIDERGLRDHLASFTQFDGIRGVVVNGHTGEGYALTPAEQKRATEVAVEAMAGSRVVVTGVAAEATQEGIDLARAAESAGASAILLMPPHQWLRFGRPSAVALRYVGQVAESINAGVIVHQYPTWTKVGYTTEELVELASIPNVVAIKDGTRDIARYERNVHELRRAAPEVAILTCHDEYLLPTLTQGVDGALVGFASLAPDLICKLVDAVRRHDLRQARAVYDQIYILKGAVYGMGEPSAQAHQRMKAALHLMGRLPSPKVRPPLEDLDEGAMSELRAAMAAAGLFSAPAGEPSQRGFAGAHAS